VLPAKKRGMYRRRYDMLNSLRQQMSDNYHSLEKKFAARTPAEQG